MRLKRPLGKQTVLGREQVAPSSSAQEQPCESGSPEAEPTNQTGTAVVLRVEEFGVMQDLPAQERPADESRIGSLPSINALAVELSSVTVPVIGLEPPEVVLVPLDASKTVPIPESPNQTEEFILAYTLDLVDKQYRLYSWNDTKTEALITTNSILFAAVGFLFKDCLGDTLAMVFLGFATITLGSSLMTCLVQVFPRLSSGKSGAGPNTRSLRGIRLYKGWEEYRDAVVKTTKESILTDTVRQIYGMAHNNLRSVKIVKRGVSLTLCGVVGILGAVFTSSISARGYHVFGTWQKELSINNKNAVAGDPPGLVTQTHSNPQARAPLPSTTPSGAVPDRSFSAHAAPNVQQKPKSRKDL